MPKLQEINNTQNEFLWKLIYLGYCQFYIKEKPNFHPEPEMNDHRKKSKILGILLIKQ